MVEVLTREQRILKTFFGGGEKVLSPSGKERNIVRIDKTLNSGGGLIKSGDTNKETASIFGIKR